MFSVRRLDLNSSLRRQIVVQSANSSYFFATLHHNIYEWKTGDLGVQTNSMLAAIFVYSVLCRSKGRVHNLVTPCQPACHIVTSWHPERWDLWLVQWLFFFLQAICFQRFVFQAQVGLCPKWECLLCAVCSSKAGGLTRAHGSPHGSALTFSTAWLQEPKCVETVTAIIG